MVVDLKAPHVCPTLEEIGEAVGNPVFLRFCSGIADTYGCREKIEYSACSWEQGWNVKFKKAGKTLCTLYPRELFFSVMVVVGKREREAVERLLPEATAELREIYQQTKEGNGQRWLMIDLEEQGELYDDVLRLIQIRRMS